MKKTLLILTLIMLCLIGCQNNERMASDILETLCFSEENYEIIKTKAAKGELVRVFVGNIENSEDSRATLNFPVDDQADIVIISLYHNLDNSEKSIIVIEEICKDLLDTISKYKSVEEVVISNCLSTKDKEGNITTTNFLYISACEKLKQVSWKKLDSKKFKESLDSYHINK